MSNMPLLAFKLKQEIGCLSESVKDEIQCFSILRALSVMNSKQPMTAKHSKSFKRHDTCMTELVCACAYSFE